MTATTKKQLREHYRSLRTQVLATRRQEAEAALVNLVLNNPSFIKAEVVASFVSMPTELNTTPLIQAAWQAHKRVCVPKSVAGSKLIWYELGSSQGFDSLVKSSFGVPEPVPQIHTELNLGEVGSAALALVPGLVFDTRGFRIGYGGGYYDRFLASFEGDTLGLALKECMVESLNALGVLKDFDIPVQQVIAV